MDDVPCTHFFPLGLFPFYSRHATLGSRASERHLKFDAMFDQGFVSGFASRVRVALLPDTVLLSRASSSSSLWSCPALSSFLAHSPHLHATDYLALPTHQVSYATSSGPTLTKTSPAGAKMTAASASLSVQMSSPGSCRNTTWI